MQSSAPLKFFWSFSLARNFKIEGDLGCRPDGGSHRAIFLFRKMNGLSRRSFGQALPCCFKMQADLSKRPRGILVLSAVGTDLKDFDLIHRGAGCQSNGKQVRWFDPCPFSGRGQDDRMARRIDPDDCFPSIHLTNTVPKNTSLSFSIGSWYFQISLDAAHGCRD